MSNLQSLTKEQAQRIGKLGGIRSGESRRNKKSFLDISTYLLSQKVNIDLLSENAKRMISQKMRYSEAIVLAQIIKAINGDTSAANYIREISGQKNAEIPEQKSFLQTFLELNKDGGLCGSDW